MEHFLENCNQLNPSDIPKIERLLKSEPSVNITNSKGDTLLHKACETSHKNIVKFLLDHGASLNIININGISPFQVAIIKGYKEVIDLLLSRKGNIHCITPEGFTCLHLAVFHFNCILAEVLLDRGANINAKDLNKCTPLHFAVYSEHVKMVELLLERGAKVNIKDIKQQTPVHVAASHRDCRIANLLLSKGGLLNFQNQKGRTPLHIAVKSKDITMVSYLLDQGALPDVRDKNHRTPLYHAALSGYSRLVVKIISRGAEIAELLPLLLDMKLSPSVRGVVMPLVIKLMIVGVITSERVTVTFIKARDSELERLKNETFSNMRLYDVFDKPFYHWDCQMLKCMQDAISSCEIEKNFPRYGFCVKVMFLKLKQRRVLFKRVLTLLKVLVENDSISPVRHLLEILAFDGQVGLLKYLSNVDLQNFLVFLENMFYTSVL